MEDLTMYQYFKKHGIDVAPKETKLIFMGEKIDAYRLLQHVDQVASFLVSFGVKTGEAVGVCLPNIPQAVAAVYGINKIGAIVNAIHPLISTKALVAALNKTGSRIVFLLDRMVAKHEAELHKNGIVIVSCRMSDFVSGIKGMAMKLTEPGKNNFITEYNDIFSRRARVEVATDPDAPAVYLHSGGTEADPKTVVLSSRAFNSLADNVIETECGERGYSIDDTMLMVLPIFHGFGLGVSLHTIVSHAKLVLMPRFDATKAVKLIKKYKVSFLAGIPQMFEKMLNERAFDGEYLSSLKYVFCGGDKLSSDLKQKFDEVLRKNGSQAEILEGYGLTEVTTVVSVNRPGECKAGSQGPAMVGGEMMIVDDAMNEVPRGTVGEILVTSSANMIGYLNDEEATKRCFIEKNGKKFVKTGDLGYMDEDGYLYFKDRKKRLIKISGVSIFPSEVEQIVESMREVDAACVTPTTVNGKPATRLSIVLNSKFRWSPLIEQRIKDNILANTIKYAVPREIKVVKSLPRTIVGKVDYKKV